MDPYGSLDPPKPSTHASVAEPGTGVALLRGARKRCPMCGERRMWESWFTAHRTCPSCALRFEKEEGGFLGAMVINYCVAIGFWLLVLGITMALTVPTVPVAQTVAASIVVLTGVPVWFYPRAKMLWAASEYLVARSQPDYRAPRPPGPLE